MWQKHEFKLARILMPFSATYTDTFPCNACDERGSSLIFCCWFGPMISLRQSRPTSRLIPQSLAAFNVHRGMLELPSLLPRQEDKKQPNVQSSRGPSSEPFRKHSDHCNTLVDFHTTHREKRVAASCRGLNPVPSIAGRQISCTPPLRKPSLRKR